MSFSYNRITYYTRGGQCNHAYKEGITKEDAIKRMVYYLKGRDLLPSDLRYTSGGLFAEVNQKTLGSLYSSEAWIEKEGELDLEEAEVIKNLISELYHNSSSKVEECAERKRIEEVKSSD